MPRRRFKWVYRIVRERIEILMNLAKEFTERNEIDLARDYIKLARRIAMKYNYKMPRIYKRFICKKCNAYLLPGKTARVRINRGKVSITCTLCGSVKRYPYLKEKREHLSTHNVKKRAS
ncbi:MAG: ribonuclease P [Thermoplasmata archaeon]|nr:MAG: ribonuclease P [Thermoplasmata archaeon]